MATTEFVPASGIPLSHHTYMGRGPGATGVDGRWHLRGYVFRCARCGAHLPLEPRANRSCPCGAMHIDYDAHRFGSTLGDLNILVYRPDELSRSEGLPVSP